jgi:iron complex transport system substrate-binding protein
MHQGCFQANSTKFIATPIENAAVQDSSSLAFFDALGELKTVTAYIPSSHFPDPGLDVVSSPCLQHLLQVGHIRDHNFTLHDRLDYDVFFVNPFESKDYHGNNSVIIGAILDPGPLHRAEWIKFVAAFVGKEAEASQIFENHRARYECLKKSVISKEYKRIAWFDEFSGTYYATTAEYLLTMFDDARSLYTPNCTDRFSSCSAAEISVALKNADVLITTGTQSKNMTDFVSSLISAGLPQETVMSFPCIKAQRVYNIDKRQGERGALDWFESAIIEPDVVLADLITVLHPDIGDTCQTLKSYKSTWLRNIATEKSTILTSGMCRNTSYIPVPLGSSLEPCACVQTSGSRQKHQYKNGFEMFLVAILVAILSLVIL